MKAAKIKSSRLFTWQPGQGVNGESRERMEGASLRPKAPMGEAWFMGTEREMFSLPLTVDYEYLPFDYVSRMLEAIGSGTTCFGEFAEWRQWFHYLLPRALRRPFEIHAFDRRLELLMTALFALYPRDLSEHAPYRQFRQDVVETAGRAIMNSELWLNGRLRTGEGLIQESKRYGQVWWYLDEANAALSCSLFFCLKYLPPEGIGEWLRSVAAVDCPYWRAQLMVWLSGAKPFLEGSVTQPSDFDDLSPRITWESSHILAGYYDGLLPGGAVVDKDGRKIAAGRRAVPFVSQDVLRSFAAACNELLDYEARRQWVDQVTAVPLLATEMGYIAEQFGQFKITAP